MDVKKMSSEELAAVISAINTTGIAPTRFERECLIEAAERLNKLHKLEVWIKERNND